jgi:hypothetical protein
MAAGGRPANERAGLWGGGRHPRQRHFGGHDARRGLWGGPDRMPAAGGDLSLLLLFPTEGMRGVLAATFVRAQAKPPPVFLGGFC